MSSQHVYYTGNNRYENPGTVYSEGHYEQPVDNHYYGLSGSRQIPGNGRLPPNWSSVQPHREPEIPNRNGKSSRQKGSKLDDSSLQDYRNRNNGLYANGKKHKGEEGGSSSDEPHATGLSHLWDKHTDKFSMSGVSYIKSTKNPIVKTAWSILLIAAVAAMGYHLYRLISTYVDFKKQTSVELSFDSLKFPAVTVCNVNPLRMSKIDLASDDLVDFIASVNPNNLYDELDAWNPEYDNVDSYYDEDEDETGEERRRRRRKKRQTSTSSVQIRSSNFLDVLDAGINDTRQWQETIDSYYDESEPDSWEAESEVSAFYDLEQSFRENFAWELPRDRAEMGHQIQDMLLQCSFAGRRCVARNFTRQLTTDFGNCYTIQYSKFVSRKSGPKYGLELKLFLETDDYVPGIATSKGVQLVIHDQDTLAFPEDEGIAVKAGTETRVGLKMIQVSRLGKPYDDCSSPEEFKRKYNIKYTRTACQNVCLYQKTLSDCNCYDILSEETRTLLNRAVRRNATACESTQEIRCAQRVSNQFDNDNSDCKCHSPCSETAFRKTVSSREWPNPAFASLLVQTVCKNNHPQCQALANKSVENIKSEFVRVIIYYEDLNFEKLTESAAYEIDQFISDIGGTIGLYIGLSVLAIFEVINLLTDVLIYLCCGCFRNKSAKDR